MQAISVVTDLRHQPKAKRKAVISVIDGQNSVRKCVKENHSSGE